MHGRGRLHSRYHVCWSDLGSVDYERAFELQSSLRAKIVSEGGPGYVLFVEHPPTITLGYSLRGDEGRSAINTPAAQLARDGISVVEVDRGGKATYHGPGQLICYPVVSLKQLRLGVKRYVTRLIEVVLNSLQELGVAAELDDSYPGAWVAGAKVAAIGIHVSEGVATHGFAINVDPQLSNFGHIVPCGIADRPVTSLASLGVSPSREELMGILLSQMEQVFKVELEQIAGADLWSELMKEAG